MKVSTRFIPIPLVIMLNSSPEAHSAQLGSTTSPAMTSLDTNVDGEIFKENVSNASTSLRSLDTAGTGNPSSDASSTDTGAVDRDRGRGPWDWSPQWEKVIGWRPGAKIPVNRLGE